MWGVFHISFIGFSKLNIVLVTIFTLGFRLFFILLQINQGSTKLSPVDHMSHWIFVLVQKDSNAKKKSICCTEPYSSLTKFTTQNRKSKKENQSFFIRQFCSSLNELGCK
jgi:hypothetical protein